MSLSLLRLDRNSEVDTTVLCSLLNHYSGPERSLSTEVYISSEGTQYTSTGVALKQRCPSRTSR